MLSGDAAPTLDQKRLQLALYELARSDMDDARWLCWYMIREGIDRPRVYFEPMLAGAVVSYARPFTRTRAPWGSLPGRFRWFENEDFARTHREILEWRKSVFAHNDENEFRRVIVVPGGTHLDETPRAGEQRQWFTSADVEAIMRVAQEQERRLKEAVRELVAELYPGEWPPNTVLNLDGTSVPRSHEGRAARSPRALLAARG